MDTHTALDRHTIMPTSTASTPRAEPEIIAGISSAEGQPANYDFQVNGRTKQLPSLAMFGAAAVLGFAAGLCWRAR